MKNFKLELNKLNFNDLKDLLKILRKNFRNQAKLVNSLAFGTEEYDMELNILNILYHKMQKISFIMRNINRQRNRIEKDEF